ncbi:MAG: glycosyltransferase family 39 protein [Candidatus Levybacteria bacterium]|nr:glycosyltransferase family 39 protein [Candidatus Levybacteria bacterium]
MRYKKILLIIFPLTFFAVGFLTLNNYGINWDEPVHYIRGQAFLRFFMTGKKDYSGLPGIEYSDNLNSRRSIYQFDSKGTNYLSFNEFVTNPGSHPPLNGIIASFFNYIFYQQLGILGDIDSYHLFVLAVSSLLVFLVFFFTREEYGLFAGIISFLSLSLYPLFFGESHFNIKDPVEASFYGWTIYSFYKGIVGKSSRWIITSSIFAGLALGTKFNIFFAFVTILFWMIILKWKELRSFKWPFSKRLTTSLAAYPFIVFIIFFISYPNLWQDPIRELSYVFSYYKEIGYGIVYQPSSYITFFGLNTYPIQAVFYTTPLITLLLSSIGVLWALTKGFHEKNKTALIIFLWFIIPIVRVSFPNMGIYGGVRQIMEYIPAMAMLSGIGGYYIVRQFSNLTIKQFIKIVILILFIPITLKIISVHPNENVYLNPLIGGLKGAREKGFPDWGVTLGSPYKQGVDWMNAHAEKNARLTLVKGLLQNIPPNALRRDILFGDIYYSGASKKGEYLMEVNDYRFESDVLSEKREYIKTLHPAYEIKVDDVPILIIWKNE